jgi:hypothetical protein
LRYISETENELRGIGFYGADFPLEHLYYILIPSILYAEVEKYRNTSKLLPQSRPPRKDGGNGWFIATEGIDRIDENFAGCNGYKYDSNGGQSGYFTYYWLGNTYHEGLNKMLHNARFFLNCIGPGNACMFHSDEDAAKAFENSLCENRNGRTYPSMPIFTQKQYDAFTAWARSCPGLD